MVSEEQARKLAMIEEQEYLEPSGPQTSPGAINLNDVFLDNSFLIDEFMHTLQGRFIDSVKNEIKQGKALIKDDAISWLIARLQPYTSKMFSLSKLDEDKIREMVYDFKVDLSGDLMYCEKHGITRGDRDFVFTLTIQTMEATLRKALDGITMIRMLSQYQIKEFTSRQESTESKVSSNILSKLRGRV